MIARADEDLCTNVREELAWDSLVDESQIDVEVADDRVTLVGTVSSYAQKQAAQAAARAVDGVHELVNEIDVRPSDGLRPSDDELSDMGRSVLRWDALVPETEVTVAVSDGWVTLGGSVVVDAQRREAERAIQHLSGLRGVRNEITVRKPSREPEEVRTAIENALRRRAAHRTAHIDITIDGNSVTLEGSVQSELEKVAILGAVGHAAGIETVCDELSIDPST